MRFREWEINGLNTREEGYFINYSLSKSYTFVVMIENQQN